MAKKIIIMAESGSDVSASVAAELGIYIVPMHVSIGAKTIDDGQIPAAEMLEECRQLGVLPKTSGCTPGDFEAAFDRVHQEHPQAKILYLAYSAVTTCSFESARAAARGRDYVVALDTQQVTIGQGFVVVSTAKHLAANPNITIEELHDFAADLSSRMRCGFIPGDLGYLRAGGRLSNAAFLGATLLRIKPVIEIVDGKLVATKKLRGAMSGAALGLMDLLVCKGGFDPEQVFLVRSPGLPESVRQTAQKHAYDLGFKNVYWYETGNVITSHSGPGSIAVALAAAKQ